MKCKCCGVKFKQKYIGVPYCMESDKCISEFRIFAKEKKQTEVKKKWSKEKKDIKEKLTTKSDYKNDLQKEINKIIKYIDKNVNCISSGRPLTDSRNSGHIWAVGGNDTLRFNLHNIYNQSISDNKEKGGKPLEAMQGIKDMYGIEQYNLVLELKSKYKYLGLTIDDLKEKIKIARQINRELEKLNLIYPPKVRIELREKYNKRIGIY